MQTKLKRESCDLSLNGLEELLDSGKPARPAPEERTICSGAAAQDWSVDETARALGLSRGGVIRRLEDGILTGYKVQRPSGWVWRVKPSWLGGSSKKHDSSATGATAEDPQACPAEDSAATFQNETEPPLFETVAGQDFIEAVEVVEEPAALPAVAPADYRELVELRTRLQMAEFQYQETCQKLDAAHYKIGYLEARLETTQEQIKLLTNSQEQRSWWRRWRQWFTTVNE